MNVHGHSVMSDSVILWTVAHQAPLFIWFYRQEYWNGLPFPFFFFYFIFKLYIIVLVLPNIKINPPQVYMSSPSWTLLPPPSPYHPSGSSQCTSPKHPVSCIEPGLACHLYMIFYMFPFPGIFLTQVLNLCPCISCISRWIVCQWVTCLFIIRMPYIMHAYECAWSFSHVWLCDSMDCSPPGSFVHLIL